MEGGEFDSCCKMLQIVAHVLPKLPWLFMKSTFNKAGYGLAWTVLNAFLIPLCFYFISDVVNIRRILAVYVVVLTQRFANGQ